MVDRTDLCQEKCANYNAQHTTRHLKGMTLKTAWGLSIGCTLFLVFFFFLKNGSHVPYLKAASRGAGGTDRPRDTRAFRGLQAPLGTPGGRGRGRTASPDRPDLCAARRGADKGISTIMLTANSICKLQAVRPRKSLTEAL